MARHGLMVDLRRPTVEAADSTRLPRVAWINVGGEPRNLKTTPGGIVEDTRVHVARDPLLQNFPRVKPRVATSGVQGEPFLGSIRLNDEDVRPTFDQCASELKGESFAHRAVVRFATSPVLRALLAPSTAFGHPYARRAILFR